MILAAKQLIALCLAWVLSTGPLTAQDSPGIAVTFTAHAVEGERAVHRTKTRTGVQTVVEVRDERGSPVAGAKVLFQLPKAGPGGSFADRSQALTVETGSGGRAATVGFKPNTDVGAFPLHIHVVSNGVSQNLVVWQTNSNDPAGDGVIQPNSSRKWWIIGLAGAGAALAIVLATRSGGSGDPGYRPGPPVVGAPR